MSCHFWLMRKKRAVAERKAQEATQEEVCSSEEKPKRAVRKSRKKDDAE